MLLVSEGIHNNTIKNKLQEEIIKKIKSKRPWVVYDPYCQISVHPIFPLAKFVSSAKCPICQVTIRPNVFGRSVRRPSVKELIRLIGCLSLPPRFALAVPFNNNCSQEKCFINNNVFLIMRLLFSINIISTKA